MVASIHEPDIEIRGEADKTALETIEHTFGRMASIWKPLAANEGYKVVRLHLFLDRKTQKSAMQSALSTAKCTMRIRAIFQVKQKMSNTENAVTKKQKNSQKLFFYELNSCIYVCNVVY